jgi:tRNA dimethylallyltransferase
VNSGRQRVLAIVGATGTGKSALADALAYRLGGEVISADSMQVYIGMDIGTAKMPPAERSVAYHCLDLVWPDQEFNAALYQRYARAAIDDVLSRGKVPVVCGGSGLYIRAALDDFTLDDAANPANTALRQSLEEEAGNLGPLAFHAKLAERDPQSARLIHPHNVRRVIRAFEFLEQGSSYAQRSSGFDSYNAYYRCRYIGLDLAPAALYERIDVRVDRMIAAGLVQEVARLVDEGFGQALASQQAIGYKELVPVVAKQLSLVEAVAQIKLATRHFAKRQRSWFKRDTRIAYLDARLSTDELLDKLTALIT